VRDAFDRDLPLLHRLEQRGLGLRRCAVDLVREQQVREDRAGRNSKSISRWLKIDEPVTSDGIKSGVNWIRVKPMLVTCAKARAISVLARPGKSSSRTCPSASIPSSTSSSASRFR
jgi:hypothetical protein